jgi:hypothetical protein
MKETLILKYLNPSTATAKGHMKRPRQGIRSTNPKVRSHTPTPHISVLVIEAVPIIAPPIIPDPAYPGPTYGALLGSHVITDDGDEAIEKTSSALGHLQTRTVALSNATLLGCFHSCLLIEAYVSLSSTIMSPMPSLPHPLRGWTTSAHSTPTSNNSKI